MTGATLAERAIALAVLAGSLGLFWLRMGGVLRVIRGSRPTAGFRISPVLPRIRRFVWEVLAQSKVIRHRPLAGIAHALVFWGFCAFALITVNHVAGAFGASFLSRDGAFGRFYFEFAAVWAALVAAAIAGLFIRRFVARPKWLGPLSPESGVIAGLIFLLTITYLAGLALEETGAAARANWWLHTLALAIFLPLIPRSKHLHLALAPIAVFLRREGFSAIPPLEGDEDFGLADGKSVTRIDALQAYSCVECGRCTEHCPASNTAKILNPKEVILGLRAYLAENGPAAEAPLLGDRISGEAAFQCTTCGACEFQCPVGVQHLPILIGLRRGAVNRGEWDNESGGRLFRNLERTGNAVGFPASDRRKFIEKAGFAEFDGSQDYCLWLGCMGAYDPQGREIVTAFASLLRAAGVSFGALRNEKCTGDPARRLGNDLAFAEAAESNIAALRSAGARKLVSICPHCVRTIGVDWREFGADFEIVHHSELLAELMPRLPLPANARGKAVFHDPCYLSRYRGVCDEPRAVVARFAEVVEPRRTRQRSFCCGAGGGQMFLGEEKGKRVNVERAEELARAGAETIATACPFCQSTLRDGLGTAPGIKLLDIAQIAAAALPK